jgi:type IV secretory pathway TraG/TraD family ATPase VirD4
MSDLFNILMHSDLTTKIFILVCIVVLSVIQFILFRVPLWFVTIALIHVLFGFFLARVTVYNPFVHVVLYLTPSLLISGILQFLFPKIKKIEPGPYDLSYSTNRGKLILNPFAGVCILGVPKAGKTASFVKPTIEQLAEKNYCGAIYDYKKWDLTSVAYSHYQNHPVVEFKMVCPFDLNYSHRVNPISPQIIQHPAYAVEAAFVFLANMMGASKSQGGSGDRYWVESASGVLAGVIWRLRCDYPQYCDLPHAISIVINKSVSELTEFLQKNDQSVFLAASYFKSLVSEKQVAGILGTLASSLSKVALPEIFYLLSGDEVDLELNNPEHPTLLTLSTIQTLDKTYAPALALIISMSLKLMNQEGRHHSAIVLDEAPTLIIPEFDRIPATARSNKIATFFIAQDMVQSEDGYGRIGRDKILATLSTHLYGKVTDPDTAERYSKMFGTVDKYYTSKSRKAGSWSNSGYTDSLREIRKYKPEKFHQLDTGEFLGVIADGNMKEFNAKFKCYQESFSQLPLVRNVTNIEIQQVFENIITKSKQII